MSAIADNWSFFSLFIQTFWSPSAYWATLSSSNLFSILFMFKCTSKSWLWCLCLMFDIMRKGSSSELVECVESFCSCEKSIVEIKLRSLGRASKTHIVQAQQPRLSCGWRWLIIHKLASTLDVVEKFACFTLHVSVVRCNRSLACCTFGFRIWSRVWIYISTHG